MAVDHLFSRLSRGPHGIWQTSGTEPISYPAGHHQACFELEDGSFWFQHRNACILKLVERFRPSGPMVDVGGGTGFVAQALIKAGFECVLLEPGEAGALIAKTQRGIPEVVCSTISGACFEPATLAAVGLFDVLEHLPDDRGAVSDLTRALQPRGLFFGTVPANPWLWSTNDVVAQHHRRYTRGSLLALFEGEFEVLYVTHFFQALTLPTYLLRTLPSKLGLAKRANVMAPAAEHGAGRGLAARVFSRLLASEVQRVERGRSQRWGASLLFAARKKA